MLIDSFQRKIEYLRFSVTDLCNLRCHYCLPLSKPHSITVWRGLSSSPPTVLSTSARGGGPPPSATRHSDSGGGVLNQLLTFEEIERMVRLFVGLGVRRVRITGGEPLVRKDLPNLIQRLNQIRGIEEVLLTTNGILLGGFASRLREAGLKKINIHLDTLSPEKFRQITRWGQIEKVLEGIREAKRVGFEPIKLNAVVQKGFNDNEVEELLLFAARNRLILRFIEMMPIGPAREMSALFVPMEEVRRRLEEKYTLTPQIGPSPGAGPAVYYQVAELNTRVGFISPLSQPFCKRCNRIRVSGDGRFQDCLAFDGTFSLRDLLRDPRLTDGDVAGAIVNLLKGKREGHDGFVQNEANRTPFMCGIGG